MDREYGKYAKPIMDELNKKFKYLTKINDSCWLIQSNKDSYCEAFFVNTTPNGHIVMSGDYDGIMARPHGNAECLPNWMAGATTLSYFAEKVHHANRYHKQKIWTSKSAKKEIENHIIDYYDESDNEEDICEYVRQYDKISEVVKITKKAKEFLESLRFDYE